MDIDVFFHNSLAGAQSHGSNNMKMRLDNESSCLHRGKWCAKNVSLIALPTEVNSLVKYEPG